MTLENPFDVVKDKHLFKIKYKDDNQRRAFADIVLELIKKFEIKDFRVIEEVAYQEPRIMYNNHTLYTQKEELNIDNIEKKFLEYYEE